MSGGGFWSQAGPRGYQPARTPVRQYSLFWHHYLGPLASSVPQVTVLDILRPHLRHNPSVLTDLFNILVMCSWYFYFCKNLRIHICTSNIIKIIQYKHVFMTCQTMHLYQTMSTTSMEEGVDTCLWNRRSTPFLVLHFPSSLRCRADLDNYNYS